MWGLRYPTATTYDSTSEVSSRKRRFEKSPSPQIFLPTLLTIPPVDTTSEVAVTLAKDSLRLFVQLNNDVTTFINKQTRRENVKDMKMLAVAQTKMVDAYRGYKERLSKLRNTQKD